MHYSAQIQVVVWFISCLFLLTYKEMAVEAVLSEPLSRPDSLLSGINTGIFREFVVRLSGLNAHIPLNTGDLSPAGAERWLYETGN